MCFVKFFMFFWRIYFSWIKFLWNFLFWFFLNQLFKIFWHFCVNVRFCLCINIIIHFNWSIIWLLSEVSLRQKLRIKLHLLIKVLSLLDSFSSLMLSWREFWQQVWWLFLIRKCGFLIQLWSGLSQLRHLVLLLVNLVDLWSWLHLKVRNWIHLLLI